MQYQEVHTIEFNDCDENEHMKIPAMIDQLMQVSEHQLASHHAGTLDLMAKGLGWVVTQYHFDINQMPKLGQKLIFSTEATGYNRFFEYRNFTIADQQGNELVNVRSQWVMFDLKKRKLIPCDLELIKEFKVPLLKKMPRFPRLRARDNYQQKRQYRVRYDDLDTNHHLTNSHYFNWFIDMFERDFLKDHMIKTIDIKFDKEVRYGATPFSCMTLEGEHSYHAIENEDGQEQTICEMTWRKI